MVIGVISDTHGLLRPEALAALKDVEALLHIGDVGDIEILDRLRSIAPVHAIRGNIDTFGPCSLLPETEMLSFAGKTFYLIHSINDLDLDPIAAGVDVVLSGHSHRPSLEEKKGVLYVNPGSAGPRRFNLPVTVAKLYVGDTIKAEIIDCGTAT